ncbi:MAG TPA: tetratricopeptide repeat protein [Ktedonobacteraceae bacterium]|nr:tetratricopeptide repeat protein [Ktedonobacteraceae bacterium]
MPGNKHVFSTSMNAADRYRWESQWAMAAQEYQRALNEFPDDATARGGLGFCSMQMKQWQPALEEYEQVLKSDPSNVIALSKTAELYVILNRRAEAYKAYLHLADLYAQAGQGARAEAAWQKTVQLSPGNPEPHERLAAYYFSKKDIALMIQEHLAAAQGYLLRHEGQAAQAQCEHVLRFDATNIQAQRLLFQIKALMQRASSSLTQEAGAGLTPTGEVSGGTAGTPSRDMVTLNNTSGGNTSIMGNMGSAGNFGGGGGPGPAMTAPNMAGGGMAPHKRISATQVTGALKQAQTFQAQGRFNDAIDLCEQILQSGFDRPDARYFLGWLYQEQKRWEEAIRQFQTLLNDPDYALSCYYALGQCYRARGDLRTATMHFDEAVDRVNLDALTLEESDQLVQLCQEAAEAHRQMGEQEQALTVYNALLGFLRSRGWNDKVAQVEFMLKQAPGMPQTPPPVQQPSTPQASVTRVIPPEQMQQTRQAPQAPPPDFPESATMVFNTNMVQGTPPSPSPQAPAAAQPNPNSLGDLPDWLTGILSDADKAQVAKAAVPPPVAPAPPPGVQAQPTMTMGQAQAQSSPDWLTGSPAAKEEATQVITPEQMAQIAHAPVPPPAPVPNVPSIEQMSPILQTPSVKMAKVSAEALLGQIAGASKDELLLKQVADSVVASTAMLPEQIRMQVVQSMQDIQRYINHGLLTPATEECLRVIDMAPQYLDIHQVLCEIYVRQGKVEQAITKYAILIDTYTSNGRIDDAVATYRRILQLEPNNLTYRVRLIGLLTAQGDKDELLRERTLAAESYLKLGYMDRALTELEQALQDSPTSVPTRLNYALALQKLGRSQQATAEYQRVLQVDPRNLIALVRWHVAMITGVGSARSTTLEVLTRIRWQLRGEGHKHYDFVVREYNQAAETYPNNAEVRFSLGQVHQQAGYFDQAIDAYQMAMRDTSYEVLARTSTAQCLLTQGKPEAAIQQLEQALQAVRRAGSTIDPTVWAARPREEGEEHQAPEVEISLLLAKVYGRVGKQEQMQAILRQVKQQTPYQDEVSSVLAEISARRGDVESALDEYSDLVQHYRSKRQADNALSVLNEMVRMAPQDPRAHAELGDIYINRGMIDEGVAELRILADLYLRHNQLEQASDTLRRIGNVYAEAGSPDEAFMNLRRAVELDPTNMDLLREVVGFCYQLERPQEANVYQEKIARYYFDTHQVKEAVAALQQLIALDRNNLDAYDMLGQTYQTVGEYEQASRVYKNLAKINPGSTIARERLAILQELRTRSA